MDPETRKALQAQFDALSSAERDHLRTLAAQGPRKGRRRPDEEEDPDLVTRTPRRGASVSPDDPHTEVLRLLGRRLRRAAMGEVALVLAPRRGRAEVLLGDRVIKTKHGPDLTEGREEVDLAAGDEVRVHDGEIVAVLPRRTALVRNDPGDGRARTMIANVDVVVHVASVVSPPLHPRIIDRVRIAVRRGGADYLLAVNKSELPGAETELALLAPYREAGLEWIPVSARSGAGLDDLRARIAGRMSAFVGHSGVGKSSLVNALFGEEVAETGAVSAGYGRGTHTTRGATLRFSGDLRLIDTPGVRSFALDDVTEEDVAGGFPEFARFECRFRDCTHTHEPGCGVRAAAETGELDPFRYDSYLRLLAPE